MSLVKWVRPCLLVDPLTVTAPPPPFVAVIPLADLTALVEGLKEINAKSVIAYSIAPELSATACSEINKVSQRLLTQLKAHRKEG